MGHTPMNMFQDAEFVQELKRPWMNFFHVLVVYGFAWLAGAAGLTLLHVILTERSPVPPSNTHKAEENHVPNVTPPVLPGGLPSDLVSTLPSGSELTLTDVIKWNENVATFVGKDVAASRDLITVKSSDLPSLGEKQLNDTNFLSSIRSLPIMSKEGRIVGVLDSNQLKEIKDYKNLTYLPTLSIDKGDKGDQRDTSHTSSIGWHTTFFPKDDLLNMKVVEYTWFRFDSKVSPGLGVAKQYFLLDPAR
jgi:hypothetical protein